MRGLDPSEFQLWAKTSRDEAPYPLIGHERPFAIKLSCLREGLSTEEGFDLDHCNNVHGPDPLTRYILVKVLWLAKSWAYRNRSLHFLRHINF